MIASRIRSDGTRMVTNRIKAEGIAKHGTREENFFTSGQHGLLDGRIECGQGNPQAEQKYDDL